MDKRPSTVSIIVSITLVAVLALMSFLIYQKLDQYLKVKNDAAVESGLLKQDGAELARLEKLESRKADLTSYAAACRSRMPDSPDESGLLDYVRSLSGGVFSQPLQISLGERVQGDGFTVMPLTITFEGKYQDLLSLLGDLRDGSRAVRVDGIDISLSNSVESGVKAEISANAFFLGNSEAPAK